MNKKIDKVLVENIVRRLLSEAITEGEKSNPFLAAWKQYGEKKKKLKEEKSCQKQKEQIEEASSVVSIEGNASPKDLVNISMKVEKVK